MTKIPEHMIAKCEKCGIEYDMDFDEALDDQHGECYSEDWYVEIRPCPGLCDIYSHAEDYVRKPIDLSHMDFSAIPKP